MRKAGLLMQDSILQRICTAELTALGAEAPPVIDAIEAIPPSVSILLVDLDVYTPTSDLHAEVIIGISRTEFKLPESIRSACDSMLHRPFSIADFRAAVAPFLSEAAAPLPRRITARRGVRIPKHIKKAQDAEPQLDMNSGRLRWENHEVLLTPSESTVFEALQNSGKDVVSRAELVSLLGIDGHSNLPDVHICAIRKKLSPYGLDTHIHTVRGKGYRLIR